MASLALTRDPRFNYLADQDRYYLSAGEPGYRFNIIGTGINGQEHIKVALMEGRSTINGIYDPARRSIDSAIREFAAGAPGETLQIYDSLEKACLDPSVDGLIICTPNYTHLEVLKAAMGSKKPIMLEKPVATSAVDAARIRDLAEHYPALMSVGLQYRFKPIYKEALYEVKERKSLGSVKKLSIQEHRIPFLDKVSQWNKFSRYSGDTLIEKCCHYFDLLNLLSGSRPVRVFAQGGTAVNFIDFEYGGERSDILDNASVLIAFENGVKASFDLCMFAPMIHEELIVCGDEGRLKAIEHFDFHSSLENASYLEIINSDERPSRKMTPSYPSIIEESGHSGATYFAHAAFIDAIEGGGSSALADVNEALWSIVVAEAAQISIKEEKVVDIEEFLLAKNITLD